MVKEAELKERLIAKINSTDNLELLEELSDIFELEEEIQDVYVLSPDELNAVKEGIEQIDSGLYFTEEEANKIIDKCLGR